MVDEDPRVKSSNIQDVIEWLENDSTGLYELLDEWRTYAWNSGYGEDAYRTYLTIDQARSWTALTHRLMAWADHAKIDDASALWEFCRGVCAASFPELPWGKARPVDEIGDAMSRAHAVLTRIEDERRIRDASEKPRKRPNLTKSTAEMWEHLQKATKPVTYDKFEALNMGRTTISAGLKEMEKHGLIERMQGGGVLPAKAWRAED